MFTNKRFPIKDQFIFPSITLLALFIYVLSSLYIRFQVTLNDFWGVLYYARHISLDNPASFYNGFFPIGYPFLLKFSPDQNVIYFAFAINIISAAIFVGLVSILFFQLKKSGWGLIAVFCIAVFYPLIFRYANTTSADISTAAFSMGGVYFLWKSELEKSEHAHQIQNDLLCGLFFGLSAIFRNHAIISTAAILLAYLSVFGFRKLWDRKIVLVSLFLVYLIQIGANLYSGHGPLDVNQNLNLYITFHGINWSIVPAEVGSFSIIDQFFKDPKGFIKIFIPLFLQLIVYGLPALLCLLLIKEQAARKFAWFVFIAAIIYSIPVAIGTSSTDRGPFPILGMAITCSGLLIMEIASLAKAATRTSKTLRGLALLLLFSAVVWISSQWASEISQFLSFYRAQNESFREVEIKLIDTGLKSPSEIFTNDPDLYFPNVPPFRPYSNGGWENFSLWGYRQQFPEIPTDTWESFINACIENKIKFLVLSPGAGSVATFIGRLYNDKFHPGGLELYSSVGDIKIFKIINSAP